MLGKIVDFVIFYDYVLIYAFLIGFSMDSGFDAGWSKFAYWLNFEKQTKYTRYPNNEIRGPQSKPS